MAKKVVLKDNSENRCYPVTREECILTGNRTLPEKLAELENKIGKINFSISNNDNWLYLITDAEGNIIFGVRKTGEIEWAIGVPLPIREYVKPILSNVLNTISKLQKEVNDKLSLIKGFEIEDSDYAYLLKDSEGKAIAGIYRNGKVFINNLDAGNLMSLFGDIKFLKNRIGIQKVYDFAPVPYVFGICNATADKPRQYLTSIYPEAFINYYPCPKVKINGKRKLNLQRVSDGSAVGESGDVDSIYASIPNVTIDNWDFVIDGEGVVPVKSSTQYVRVKNTLASGQNIFLLNIGDSTSAQTLTNEDGSYEDGWCYPSVCQKMAELDSIDLEKAKKQPIKFKTLGHSGNVNNVTFTYREETRELRSFREAMGGWATYCWMNFPIQVRLNFTFEAPYYQFGGEEMWYYCGLATKTPFDSDVPEKSFEKWIGSIEQIKEVCTTPLGRYKPDLGSNEEEYAINGIQNLYKRFAESSIKPNAVWDGDELKKTAFMGNYNAHLSNYPQNPFYDCDKGRAYTGEHVWTYDNAFSVDKWLERYRTLDDKGVRLNGSAGQEVEGSDGSTYRIGTYVTDVNSCDVCVPTHVFICLGINDDRNLGLITETQKETMASLFEEKNSGVKIGFGYLRLTGSADPMDWQDVNVDNSANTVGSNAGNRDVYFKQKYNKLGKQRMYIPTMYTEGMRGRNSSGKALDFDTMEYVSLSTDDVIHPSLASHYGVAYQVLAWTYLTFENKEIIKNF